MNMRRSMQHTCHHPVLIRLLRYPPQCNIEVLSRLDAQAGKEKRPPEIRNAIRSTITGVYYSESNTFMKDLREQPMRLESFIRQHAHKDAYALFAEHQQDQSVRVEPERVHSLAQFEANQFYQHGFVLLFLKASLLGNEQEVTNLYIKIFTETYSSLNTARTSKR